MAAKVKFELAPELDGQPVNRFEMAWGGELVTIEDKPFETDDPTLIAELDAHPAVQRATGKPAKGDDA